MSLYRLQPVGPVTAYKSYEIVKPRATHTRIATCEEVDCVAFHNGWVTRVPTNSDLERMLLASGRHHAAREVDANGTVAYTFLPGTECFRSHEHRVAVDRPALYRVRDGDWRGNPTGSIRTHVRPEDWVEDFATHTDKIAQAIEKG